jgi:hypothetical protein
MKKHWIKFKKRIDAVNKRLDKIMEKHRRMHPV